YMSSKLLSCITRHSTRLDASRAGTCSVSSRAFRTKPAGWIAFSRGKGPIGWSEYPPLERKLDTFANNASNLSQKGKRKATEKNEGEVGSARSGGAGAGASSKHDPQNFHDPTKPLLMLTISENEKTERMIAKLAQVFKDKEQYRKLLSYRGSHAQRLLDLFQRLLDAANNVANNPPLSFQQNLIAATQRLANKSGLYPRCYELDNVTTSDRLENFGGSSDIYKGLFRGRAVVLKEAILWEQLRHPNLLPFYGVYRYKGMVSFVSPWMVNGDIQTFLKFHQDSNRVILAFDVAQGLRFLHNNCIVRGDLKGPNILINEFERACIADFGLSSVSDKEILTWTSHSSLNSKGGTVRWQAPELFDPEGEEDILNTNASDIYAWACVAYEIFAGQLPFAHITREATIVNRVRNGQRLDRPLDASLSWNVWGLTEEIWALMETCWDFDPTRRPTIDVIIECFERSLPQDAQLTKEANGEFLSPGQFREMMRGDYNDIENELSIEMLESRLQADRQ
ncbi:hypothetical protein H0H92_008759, partial [Tricholoma furcatifolium]